MNDNDNRKWLYETLKTNGYNMGSYDEFNNAMDNDEVTRRWCYDQAASKGINMGSYDEYTKAMVKVQQSAEQPQVAQPAQTPTPQQQPTAYNPATFAPMAQQAPGSNAPNVRAPFANEEAQRQYEQQRAAAQPKQQPTQEQAQPLGPERFQREMEQQQLEQAVINTEDAHSRFLENIRKKHQPFGNNQIDALAPARQKRMREEQKYNSRVQLDELKGDIDNRIAEIQNQATADWRARDEKRGFWERAARSLADTPDKTGGVAEETARMYEEHPELRELTAASRSIRNAMQVIGEAEHNAKEGTFESSWFAGLGRGFGQKLSDVRTWDMGITDVQDNSAILKALDAFDRGEQLTESQQALLDAKAIELCVNEYFGSEVGRGYKAGATTAEAIPFMIEMVANPLLSAGKGATRLMARYAVKRFGKEAAKKVGRKIFRGAIRGVADVVGSAAGTATTGAIGTYAGTLDRMIGDLQYDTDKDGNVVFSGHENMEDPLTALGKEFSSQTIERWSEMAGVYNEFVPKVLGKLMGKGLNKIGLGAVTSFFERVPKTQWGKAIGNFMERTQWHGPIGEFLEEIEGGTVNALMHIDQTLDTNPDTGVFNKDNLIDTFEGVAVMGVMFAGAGTLGYVRGRANLRKADKKADLLFGNYWPEIRDLMTNGSYADRHAIMEKILSDPTSSEEQKKALLDYDKWMIANALRENVTDRVYADPSEMAAGVSFDNGYFDADTEEKRYDAYIDLGEKENAVRTLLGDETFERLEDAPIDVQKELEQNGNLTDEQRRAIANYVAVKYSVEGIEQRINDDTDMMAAEQREEAKVRTNKNDGAIHPATLKETDADGNPKEVYVVDGEFSMDAEGNISGGDVVVIYDPVEGKNREISPMEIASLGEVTTAEQQEQNIEANKQAYKQQQMDAATGRFNPQPGQEIEIPNAGAATVLATDGETVTLQMPDGTQQSMAIADIQQIADGVAMEDYRQRHPEAVESGERRVENGVQPSNKIEGVPEEFVPGMTLTVTDRDGNEHSVTTDGKRYAYNPMTGELTESENGNYLKLTDENGEVLSYDLTGKGYGSAQEIKDYEMPKEEPAKEEVAEGTQEETQPVAENAPIEQPQAETPAAEVEAPTEEVAEQPAKVQMPTHKVKRTINKEQVEVEEEDFEKVPEEDTYKYLYEDQIDEDFTLADADALVAKQLAQAKTNQKNAENNKSGGVEAVKMRKRAARKSVEYWEKVAAMRQAVVDAEKAEASAQRRAELEEQQRKDAERHDAAVAQREADLAEAEAKRVEQERTGANAAQPIVRERWNASPKVEGFDTEFNLPNGETIDGRYVLVESGAATPSHDPTNNFTSMEGYPVDDNGNNINDRDYQRSPEAMEHTRNMAANYDGRALQSIPVVSREGVVLSGNGRTMAGMLAAQDGTDGVYKEKLKKRSREFGFTPEQVEAMQHPRVVFVPNEDMPYTTETLAKFNESNEKQMSPSEKAFKYGKMVDNDTFGRIMRTINGFNSLADFYADRKATDAVLGEMITSGIYNKNDIPALYDGEKLSESAKADIESILIGKFFEKNPDMVNMIVDMPAVRQKVVKAMQEIADNANLGEDYSLQQQFADAVGLVYKAKNAGSSVADHAKQYGIDFETGEVKTAADINNLAVLRFADVLTDKSVNKLKDVFTLYNDRSRDAAQGQSNLFAENESGVQTREEILKEVIDLIDHGRSKLSIQGVREETERAVRRRQAESNAEADASARSNQGQPAGEPAEAVGEQPAGEVAESREERDKRLEEERKQRILDEGTGYDKPFGLTPVSETMTADEIGANVRRIVEGLKANEGNGTLDTFEGFAYNGNYKKNAGHQVDEYLLSLTGVVPDATLRQWYESEGLKTRDDIRALGEKLYAVGQPKQQKVDNGAFDGALSELEDKGISIDSPELLDKYGLKNVTLEKRGNHVTLTHFISNEQGNGNGTRFMQDLTEIADRNGWTLALTPDDSFGATSVKRLKDFYKRFGFKDNKGRNSDFETRESMVRQPQSNKKDRALLEVVMDKLRKIIGDRLHTTLTEDEKRLINWARAAYHRVFHGTAKDFDKFDKKYRGSGVGAARFGGGWYVTGLHGRAKGYAVDQAHSKGGSPIVYEVEIPDDNGSNYLDWYATIPKKERRRIAEAIRNIPEEMLDRERHGKNWLPGGFDQLAGIIEREQIGGMDLYDRLYDATVNGFSITKFLSDLGYVGTKYHEWSRPDDIEYVVYNDKDMKIVDKVKFFKTPQGEVYGFTVGGNIYVDMDIAKADTPIHEYGHLWVPMVRESDPEMWEDIKSVLTKDKDVKPFMDIVRQRYPELTAEGREDDFMEEVFTHFSGDNGLKMLEEAAKQYEEKDGQGFISNAKAIAALNKVKEALDKFWGKVAQLFGIKFRNAREVANKMFKDFMDEVDPTKVAKVNNGKIRFQFAGERGAAAADKAEEVTHRMDNLGVAREMESSGKDAKAIKMATGWERGADGKWRYETEDFYEADKWIERYRENVAKERRRLMAERKEAERNYLRLDSESEEGKKARDEFNKKDKELTAHLNRPLDINVKLSEVIGEDNPLFKTYPQLKDVNVEIGVMKDEDTAGSYNEESNTIRINGLSEDSEYNEVLAHEVQHAIQHIEGFAEGGSPKGAADYVKGMNDKAKVWTYSKEVENVAKELGTTSPYEIEKYIVEDMLGAKTPEAVAEAEKDGWIPDSDGRAKGYNLWARGYDNEGYEEAYNNYYDKMRESGKAGFWDGTPESLYARLAGEVEARNAARRRTMTAEERRNSLAEDTEDVAREDQIFLFGEGGINAMGSTVNKRKEDIANKLEGRELTEPQKIIVDVFTGKDDRVPLKISRDGKDNEIIIIQGVDDKAGTKHSIFTHYDTTKGVITADDILLIPDVLSKGERTETKRGNVRLAKYQLTDENGKRLTVLTELKKKGEVFNDFYSNKKAPHQTPQMPNGDTSEDAWTNDVSANSGAKVQQNSETAKNNSQEAENYGVRSEVEPYKAPKRNEGEDLIDYAKRVAEDYEEYKKNTSINNEDNVPRVQARDAYERSMGYGANQFKEAVQDSMLSLKELYRAILGKDAKIEEVKGYENAYLAENRMHSASEAQTHAYQKDFMVPIVDAIYDLIGRGKFNKEKYDDLVTYMMAKHGLERNRVFAERDAQAAAKKGADYDEELQKNQQRDYAGLTALTGESDVATAEAMAQKMVDDYEANHDTTALWEKINRATKQSLYTLYSSGMMTKERYEQIRDMFDYYIPLQGFDSTVAEDVYAYLGSDGTLGYGTPIRTAKGRRSKADDPIATIAMNGEAAIRSANRNEMKKNFLNFVQNHPSDLVSVSDVWLKYNDVTGEWEQVTADLQEGDSPADVERKTKAFDEKMEQLSKSDPDHYKRSADMPNVPYRVVQSGNMKQHQVTVKRNGKDYVLTINGNPRAAQALNGLTNPDVFTEGVFGKAMNLGQWLNRQLSAFYTTRNPEFVLSNFLRDAIYSNVMVGTKEDGKYAMQFHKNFGKMNPVSMGKLFAAWENGSLREKVRQGTCTETERMFYDFMMNGGETGWTNMRDIEKHKKEIQDALKMEGSTNRKAWKALGSAFDLMNRSVENCARFAAFVTSREMGRSLERSIWDAKEISVNFNKKGAGDKFLTAKNQNLLGQIGAALGGLGRGLYVFWNASVQGLNNIARGAKKNPWKFVGKIVATNFLLGALMPILNEILTGGDDDDENSYYNLPEYIRRSNICFRFSKNMPWITIPLPIEFRAIYGLGELATGMLTGKERYSDEEFAKQFVSQLSQVLPLDFMEGGGGWHALIPSQLKPFVEAQTNKSWTGLPIYKDTPFNQNDPEWTKAYKSANKQLVEATKWLNDLTNGKDYAADEKKGWIDINPAKLEYMLKGYFGGYTTMLDRFVKTAETVFGDRDFEWRNIPMASRVLREGDERTANRKLTNEYFDLLKEYDETKSIEKKKREKAESGDYVAKADYVAYTNFNENYKKAQVIDNFKPLLDALHDEKKNQSEYSVVEIEERENELRREMVDLIHSIQDAKKGQMPDIETPVDHMLDREMDRHGYTSKAAASRIASRMGGTDGYGHPDKDDKKGQVYFNLRDHYDLRQDVAMQVAIKQAKDAGDEDLARELNSERNAYNKNKEDFEYGAKEAEQALQWLREERERALEDYKIPFDKRPKKQ